MGDRTKIEYVDASWNPVVGCSKVSAGCAHCWAERQAKRWGQEWGTVRLHPERLDQPSRWKKPRRIAVCFMGDLFHEQVPGDFISDTFTAMLRAPRHTFLVLTKRPDRMRGYMIAAVGSAHRQAIGPVNIWPGVSVEDPPTADERIPILLDTPAAHRWVSIEPMLGPVDATDYLPDSHDGHPDSRGGPWLDWVVLGGETGPGARPMHPDWVRKVRDDCAAAGVPFFFKQWGEWAPAADLDIDDPAMSTSVTSPRYHGLRSGGGMLRVGKRRAGRLLDGCEHAEIPE